MRTQRCFHVVLLLTGIAVLSLSLGHARASVGLTSVGQRTGSGPIEPGAGAWQTWVLASGSQLRLPPPLAAHAEIGQVHALASRRDAAGLDLIQFWDAGAPAYRWNEMAISRLPGILGTDDLPGAQGFRGMALLSAAIYDATVAAWDTKYAYNRPRPSELDPSLAPAVSVPRSPSYPSEHAVVAGAASAVLAYLIPNDAELFANIAEEAAQSRVLAGIQYPSDVEAGLALGRAVAALAIERARADGSDTKWTGSVPTGPGFWTGSGPFNPLSGTWQPWALSSGSQLRPPPPPAVDSPEMAAELDELKSFRRTFDSNRAAFRWAPTSAVLWPPLADQKIFEYRLDANPPRAARVYALASIAAYDAFIAVFDAKYTYWSIRPHQLDSTVTTLFPVPPHPSYPSGHSAILGAAFETLGHLFPRDAAFFKAQAEQMAQSRMWSGLHFRTDNEVGLAQGRAVAQVVIERARADGSE